MNSSVSREIIGKDRGCHFRDNKEPHRDNYRLKGLDV